VDKIEQQVLEALKQLERAVEKMRDGGPKPDLPGMFARLDELTRQLPATTDRQLLHYLHRKSYQKAREFLEEQAAKPA